MNINLLALQNSISALSENTSHIKQLFENKGELLSDPDDVLKVVQRPSGVVINPSSDNSIIEILCGLQWFDDVDSEQIEIADIVLYYNNVTGEFVAAATCGVSFSIEDWNSMY